MKKNIFLLAALSGLAILQTSCSDDDNNGNNNNNNNNPPQEQSVHLFTSSGTSGMISVTDLNATTATVNSFTTGTADGEGIYYDSDEDIIIQASRTNNRLDVYSGITNAIDNGSTSLTVSGSSPSGDFINPREIAVSGDNVFVAQDEILANGLMNKILVYSRTGSGFTLQRTFDIGFKLWGIHADGNDLYAVVDNTGDIVKFDNILANSNGALSPSKRVTIEGLVRTHGITYSAEDNTMVLTDIGLATSDSDGGLIVIENFNSVFNGTASGGTIAMSSQKRIYGASTTLGNPVDVAYDHATNKIYVAERLNAGGRVLTFNFPTAASANTAPANARAEAAVSGVYLSRR